MLQLAELFLVFQCTIHFAYGQEPVTPSEQELFDKVFGPPPANITECECVTFDLCDDKGNIKTDGADVIDIRAPSPCPSVLQKCCKIPFISSPTSTKPTYQRSGKCGKRNVNGAGFRITTPNNESQFGEFPWMICLLKIPKTSSNPDNMQYFCGGSLIHPKVVLTATHCILGLDSKQIIARAGEWDSQYANELQPHQDRHVSEIISHPHYYSGGLYNDISLIFLTEPFEYASNVDIICLPEKEIAADGVKCIASGWGKDKFGKEGILQNILKRVDLPTVSRAKCNARLRTTHLGPKFQLHQSLICAGGEAGVDTCEGDGGSPLVCPVEGSVDIYQQVGMVAWGIGCGQAIPAAYVNIASFRPWIEQELRKRNLHIEESAS